MMENQTEEKTLSAAEPVVKTNSAGRKTTTAKTKKQTETTAKKTSTAKRSTKTASKAAMKKTAATTKKAKPAAKNRNADISADMAVKETPAATAKLTETGIWKNFWKCLKKYFTFSGRASRYEYFSFGLCFFFITLVTSILGAFFQFLSWVSTLCYLLLIIPMFAVLSRRFHDIGKNLWNGFFNWIVYGLISALIVGTVFVIFSAAPVKLAVFGALQYALITFVLFGIAASLRCLVYVCRRGQTETNQYGDVPVLNNPATEKTAFWIIVFYFSLNIFVYVLTSVLTYAYQKDLQENALKTEAQFILSQRAIDKIYTEELSYTWLNNQSALDLQLLPPDMPVAGGTGIVSALGLPVNFYGFLESYLIVMWNVDTDTCHTILNTPWRLHGLQLVQIRQNQAPAVALTNASQCYPCMDGNCEISWIIQ